MHSPRVSSRNQAHRSNPMIRNRQTRCGCGLKCSMRTADPKADMREMIAASLSADVTQAYGDDDECG